MKLRTLATVCLLLTVVACGGCDRVKARSQVVKGNELFETRNYAKAITLYQSAIALNPGLRPAHINLGLALIKLGRFQEALQQFETLLQEYPEDRKIENILAYCYRSMFRWERAMDIYKMLLERDSEDYDALYNLAWCQQSLGQTEQALRTYRSLVEAREEYENAYYQVNLLLRKLASDAELGQKPELAEELKDVGKLFSKRGQVLTRQRLSKEKEQKGKVPTPSPEEWAIFQEPLPTYPSLSIPTPLATPPAPPSPTVE